MSAARCAWRIAGYVSGVKFGCRVILASASPRRRELLSQIVPEFQVIVPNIDEDKFGDDDPRVAAISIARAKAAVVAAANPDALVIAGDTVVAVPLEAGYM